MEPTPDNAPGAIGKSELSLSAFQRLVEVCDRYEAALRARQGPSIEQYLGDALEPERTVIRLELAALTQEYGSEPAADPLPSGSASQDYEILQELGRGGMGIVYKARQVGLDRHVALKMILAEVQLPREHLARFLTEAQAVARLSHPNIVQIHEIGERDGRPFLSLELVEGGSLARKLAGGPLPVRQAARIAEQVARAMQAAHERGIIHRDLKPGNILLTYDGEPKITDFGLAMVLAGTDARATKSGMVLGTPAYMAPEQAQGLIHEVGPASDVYSIGATLYEMLTGRPPFDAPNAIEAFAQLLHEDPVPPSRQRAKLPRDLETICLKRLEKAPANRYPSAADLADDLQAFLGGEPIKAQPAGASSRLLRWARRRPAAVVLIGTAMAAFVGLLIGIWWYSALAVSGVAVLSLIVGGSWYSSRLQRALGDLAQQRIAAERYAERLQLLGEMTRRLMTTKHLDRLLHLLGETATRVVNAELATIYLVDHERRELWSKVTLDVGVGEIRVPIGVGIAGNVALTHDTVNIPNAYADSRFNPAIDVRTGYRTRNLLTIPMFARDGRLLGVFQIINKRHGAFDREDEEILASLAASAAVAIESAQHDDRPIASPTEQTDRGDRSTFET